MTKKTLFWFRQDLRLQDNPGLYKASQNGPVMAIYIFDDTQDDFKMGSASRWWLHQSLLKLNASLGYKLNIYQGKSEDILLNIIKEHTIEAVYWNRCYEPWRIQNDTRIKTILKETKVECESFNASLLWEPWEVMKRDATPYKVFTAFYQRGCLSCQPPRPPLPEPHNLQLIQDPFHSIEVERLGLLPSIKWDSSLETSWQAGEDAAQAKLNNFLEKGLYNYKKGKNFPSNLNVSKLSPHLHFGEISPHEIWRAIQEKRFNSNISYEDIDHYLTELAWREFSYYLLYHFPDLPRKNFQRKFDHFPWQNTDSLLKAWQRGQTGYPMVDAGMRELWQTGYMHNRLRMVVGSFLIKNLLIHWHHGEDWFWDCLVDADLANNSAGWQWIAGSGADAAPYFRIFNPVTQAEKFDPEGLYIKRFVPELKDMPLPYLFRPWETPVSVLRAAGVRLGETYPLPIVDLEDSRKKALDIYASMMKT